MKSTKKLINLKNLTIIFTIIYFSVFLIYPVYKALVGSFHDWNPLTQYYEFIGLENYKYLFSDPLFYKAMGNTFYFVIICTVARVVIGLLLALAIHSKLTKYKTFFQGLYYMPTITPLVAVSFVWMWMFNPQFGLINNLLNIDINWLKDSAFALPAIMIMTIWKDFGYAAVLFLAGLMGLPEEVYEAAEMDGASKLYTFKRVTLPLLSPTTLFVVITSLISYFQTYIQVMIMTEGGPGTSTYVISYLIYDEAFVKYNFGYASALAMILFVIIGILTIIMFKVNSRRYI